MHEFITIIALFSGIIAGLAHTLGGPDHLAAIAPMLKDKDFWKTGFSWGLGHTLAIVVLSLLVFLFREAIPVEKISQWNEVIVGVLLIFLGIRALSRNHGKIGKLPSEDKRQSTPLAVGLVHGLAGSAHILGVLPGMAFSTELAATLYLAGFALGSIAAMTGFSWSIGKIFYRKQATERQISFAQTGFACLSIVAGVFWLSFSG